MTVKFMFAGVAAVAALSFATPASAAPIEQLDCVEATIGAPALSAVGRYFSDIIDEAGNDSTYAALPPEIDMIAEAASACAKKFGWTKGEMEHANTATLLGAMANGIGQELSGRGIDVKALDEFIASRPDMHFDVSNITEIPPIAGFDPSDPVQVSLISYYGLAFNAARSSRESFINGDENQTSGWTVY